MAEDSLLPLGGISEWRLAPPAQQVPLVDRVHLLERLERDPAMAATIVSAPAGFGKSLLLARWRDRQTLAGKASVWLSLDEADRNVPCFAQTMAFALQCAGIFGPDGEPPVGSDTLDAYSTRLARALSTRDCGRLTLFLDGFERIAGSPAAGWIADLSMRLPGQIHWAIATRIAPLSTFSHLRVRGFLQVLSDEDLRFSPRETAALLARRLGPVERKMIEERTEGWPVAVQALRQEMANGIAIEAALARLSGRRGLIADYIESEIVAPLPHDLGDFLLGVSILPEIDAASADLIRKRSDSRRLLASLEQLGSLVHERPHERWRLHPLIREHMEARFEQQPETDIVARRMAAANLLVARQDYAGAARNALLAGRTREAVELIDGVGAVRLWQRFGLSYMKEVMTMLPPDLVGEYPALRVGDVMILLSEGRVSAGVNLLGQIRANAEQEMDDKIRLRDFKAEIAGVEVIISLIQDCISEEDVARIGALSAADASRLSDELNLETASLRVIAHLQWGDLDEAELLIPLARQWVRRWGSNFNDFFLEVYQGWVVQARGKPKEAIVHYRRALAVLGNLDDPGLPSLAEAMIAEALYISGDFKGATEQVDTWLAHLERSLAWYDYFVALYGTAASLRFRSEGLNAALAMVERMRLLALDRKAASLLRLIPPLKLSFLLRAGSWQTARLFAADEDMAEACRNIPDNLRRSSWRERDLLRSAMAEFYIVNGSLAEARTCIELMAEDAAAGGRAAAGLSARLLRVALIWRQGAHGQAVALLGEAVEEVVQSGQLGLPERHAYLLERPLKALRQAKAVRTAAARRLIESMVTDIARRKATRSSRLTPREHEVLTLVGAGDSNKRIARQLAISENTVKFHLKRISVKVDEVGSRRVSLVHAARHRGIFS
jgi:LuxR family maltose regulon positive regulatory protein